MMTDEEIIKSMECCTRVNELGCVRCSFNNNEIGCSSVLMKAAYFLLERQKSEIERLQSIINMDIVVIGSRGGKIKHMKQDTHIGMNEVKSEAIKEFAERLKKRADKINISCSGGYEHITRYKFSPRTIDNLVKEMTEGEND